jgi:hypothetical protein
MSPSATAISFTPEVLKAKLRALEEHGRCQTRRPLRPAPPSLDLVRGVSGSTFSIFTDHHTPGRWRVAGPVWAVRDLMGVEPEWRPPFGAVGQRLWVRERARVVSLDPTGAQMRLRYELDGEYRHVPWPERIVGAGVGHCIPNGVHREGARHFLEAVEVRAERVAEISDDDACLEGIEAYDHTYWTFNGGLHLERTPQRSFFALYDSIYGTGAHSRDWCWVYTLKRATINAGRT